MDTTLKQKQTDMLCVAEHPDPFSFLGIHKAPGSAGEHTVRVFLPDAAHVWLAGLPESEDIHMSMTDNRGLFETKIPSGSVNLPYLLRVKNHNGDAYETFDPYSFGVVMSDYDIYLFNEGSHTSAYGMLGARQMTLSSVKGTYFSVWAPNARRVSVIGSFNSWDGRRHPMRRLGMSGIYELFIPGVGESDLYKFEIRTPSGTVISKNDPYSKYNEGPPRTASVIYDTNRYVWGDSVWLEKRKTNLSYSSPVSIYECQLQSWMKADGANELLSYREIAPKLLSYLTEMGYTHVELMPVMEHPFGGSWGYQITGYFAPTSRMGEPDGLMYLIDTLHQHGIGVILDWVPGHFPKDSHGLEKFDGSCLYEYDDPLKAEHKDWGTLVFDYSRNEVRSFLVSNALFWFDVYHADGLRVDAVASMLYLNYSRKDGEWRPNIYGGKENLEAVSFLKHLNSVIFSYHPDVMMIAEESTSYPLVSRPVHSGGLGFSHKWNMGWMNDFLKYMKLDPYFRRYNHNNITFSLMYAYSENFILPLSHDEVVHGKGSLYAKIPGDAWQKLASLRTAMAFMFAHPGKKMLFMGNDIAQKIEWNHDTQVEWALLADDSHKAYQSFVKDLLLVYRTYDAFYLKDYDPAGFEWINANDSERSIFSFIRYGANRHDHTVCVFNFTPVAYAGYILGVPVKTIYTELLNSDSHIYGGSNQGNLGRTAALDGSADGKPYSISITVPPLAALYFVPEKEKPGK